MHPKTFACLLFVAASVALPTLALADTPPVAPASVPPAPKPPSEAPQAEPKKITPAEDPDAAEKAFQVLIRRNREQNLRSFLASRGVEDKAAQEALVASVGRQEQARTKIRDMGHKLLMALTAPSSPSVDGQIKKLTDDYQSAVDEFARQQRQTRQDLEKQFQISKNPRLQGAMLVLGVTEDAPPLLPDWQVPGTAASAGR